MPVHESVAVNEPVADRVVLTVAVFVGVEDTDAVYEVVPVSDAVVDTVAVPLSVELAVELHDTDQDILEVHDRDDVYDCETLIVAETDSDEVELGVTERLRVCVLDLVCVSLTVKLALGEALSDEESVAVGVNDTENVDVVDVVLMEVGVALVLRVTDTVLDVL